MALQMETYLSGRINNVVFFKRAGTYMARSLPAKVKLSAATKVCSGNFGIASACGKGLRRMLQPILPFAKDRRMQIQFSGAIAKWLGASVVAALPPTSAVPFVNQFQFNTSTSIAERWKVILAVDHAVADSTTIHIPAFVPTAGIAAPTHTVQVECTITVAGWLLADAAATGSDTANLIFPYNNTPVNAQSITMQVASPTGAIVITAVALRYQLAEGVYCSKPAFLPASVIDARFV